MFKLPLEKRWELYLSKQKASGMHHNHAPYSVNLNSNKILLNITRVSHGHMESVECLI